MAPLPPSKRDICNLDDDLLMDILSRLPPKTLITCKCISKTFLRIVSTLIHPQTIPRRPVSGLFIGLHDLRGPEAFKHFHRRGDEIGIAADDGLNMDEGLSFLPCLLNTYIIDCRDGFLLCSSWGDPNQYYVCNPVTRQWASLPRPPKHGGSGTSWFDLNIALVLDYSSDVFLSHYKVIKFVTVCCENSKKREFDNFMNPLKDGEEHPLSDLYVYVYSSQTGRWVESNAHLKGANFTLTEKPCVFLDGALFLPADTSKVLMFDVKEEYCKVLDLPTDLGISRFVHSDCLGGYEGRLSYAYHDDLKMEVWMIDSTDTSKWVLKHRINLYDFTEKPRDILAFHPNLDAVFLTIQFDFFCYDFSSRALKRIMCYNPWVGMLLRVFPFSKCLRSLANAYRRI